MLVEALSPLFLSSNTILLSEEFLCRSYGADLNNIYIKDIRMNPCFFFCFLRLFCSFFPAENNSAALLRSELFI